MLFSKHQELDFVSLLMGLENEFKELNLHFLIGFEVEFYLPGGILQQFENFSPIVTQEEGKDQFELNFLPLSDIKAAISQVNAVKNQIKTLFKESNFSTKPFLDRPSSGTHISVSLWKENQNLYAKNEEGKFTKEFIHSISGLEDLANDLLLLYTWDEDGMKRITPGMNTPSKICWGINNRTTSFRVPKVKGIEARIENRLISNNAPIEAALFATLFSIYHGMKNKLTLHHKIYGRAHDEQYELINLLKNYNEALYRFKNSNFFLTLNHHENLKNYEDL